MRIAPSLPIIRKSLDDNALCEIYNPSLISVRRY